MSFKYSACRKLFKPAFLVHLVGGLVLVLSLPAFAGDMGSSPHLWSVTGSLGYTFYDDMYREDGQTPIGRLALGRDLFLWNSGVLGIEIGVQNGNTMRFYPSEEAIDALGGLPIQTTVKPMLDLLATFQTRSFGTTGVFAEVKGGIAYRRWQFNDRNSINDLSKIAGEVQAGLGYQMSEYANLNLLYQGVFGASPNFTVDTVAQTGHVDNIPIQNGVLLGLQIIV